MFETLQKFAFKSSKIKEYLYSSTICDHWWPLNCGIHLEWWLVLCYKNMQ